jgi:hypothetical protein
MADKINRELYSFSIDIEREKEKEITKEKKRKNKETGKMETIEETVIRNVKEKVPVRIVLRKPSRTQIEDGDMFYSIWLNKFIKMGLLTRAMLAKKQVDVGGTLNEDDKMNYAKLYLKLFEKQQNIIRYSAKDTNDMSADEQERLQSAVSELAVIRKQLSDFEAAQASIFDHTADVKARNKTITWFLLFLANFQEGEGDSVEDEAELRPIFAGTDYDEKYRKYQELDEEQDEIFLKSIDKLSTVATIWYMSGVQDQEQFDAVLDQMGKEADADPTAIVPEPIVADEGEQSSEEEEPEQEKEDTPKKKRAATKRGRPKKAPVDEG